MKNQKNTSKFSPFQQLDIHLYSIILVFDWTKRKAMEVTWLCCATKATIVPSLWTMKTSSIYLADMLAPILAKLTLWPLALGSSDGWRLERKCKCCFITKVVCGNKSENGQSDCRHSDHQIHIYIYLVTSSNFSVHIKVHWLPVFTIKHLNCTTEY